MSPRAFEGGIFLVIWLVFLAALGYAVRVVLAELGAPLVVAIGLIYLIYHAFPVLVMATLEYLESDE